MKEHVEKSNQSTQRKPLHRVFAAQVDASKAYRLHWAPPAPASAIMKLVVIAFLIVIVASLASALIYLIRDKGQSDRTVKALTVRVALSVTLFLLLMIGYYFGIIPQQGF
jgi:succinate dehydrogenase/fumarate reductase cytochrome b subunit